MDSRILLEILCQERTSEALDENLLKCESYMDAERNATKAFDHVSELGLNKKQRIAVDRAISAYTHVGAERGRVAYQLGFNDGLRLVFEIIESINC